MTQNIGRGREPTVSERAQRVRATSRVQLLAAARAVFEARVIASSARDVDAALYEFELALYRAAGEEKRTIEGR